MMKKISTIVIAIFLITSCKKKDAKFFETGDLRLNSERSSRVSNEGLIMDYSFNNDEYLINKIKQVKTNTDIANISSTVDWVCGEPGNWSGLINSQGIKVCKNSRIISKDNLSIEDNNYLRIKIEKNPTFEPNITTLPAAYGNFKYQTGGLRSIETFELTEENPSYYFEIKCKIPKGRGVGAAFWLYDYAYDVIDDNDEMTHPEIDIMESMGDFTSLLPTARYQPSGENGQYVIDLGEDVDLSDWNRIGFEWTKDELIWYVNDKRVHSEISNIPNSRPMSIVASVNIPTHTNERNAEGEFLTVCPDDSFEEANFDIEYIKVYGNGPTTTANSAISYTDGNGNINEITSYGDWSKTWSHIEPINYSGGGREDLLLFDQGQGKALFSTLSTGGRLVQQQEYLGWRKTWSHLTPIDIDGDGNDELLLYDAEVGEAFLYDVNSYGQITTEIAHYTGWRKTWSIIKSGDLTDDAGEELMLYDGANGDVSFQYITNQGTHVEFATATDWRQGWDQICIGNFTSDSYEEILLYDKEAGDAAVINITTNKSIHTIKAYYDWSRAWSNISCGNFSSGTGDEIVLYNKKEGVFSFFNMDNNGQISEFNEYRDTKYKWDYIVSGLFSSQSIFDGFLFY